MKIDLLRPKFALAIALVTCSTLSYTVSAQDKTDKAEAKLESKTRSRDFCSNDNYSGDTAQFREERTVTLPSTGSLSVDGDKNGGIRVVGSDRSDILVRACVQTWATTDADAKALASGIRIETAGTVHATSSSTERNWSVSYEISVPRNTGLDLKANNGGISIANVDGRLNFETMNGGVALKDISGDVKGRTTNGGVTVALSADRWNGSGLDVETTNGGVVLSVPESFAAHVESGTVHGGFKSDFAALNVERDEKWKPVKVNADLNGGGPTVRVITTNGGVVISSSRKTEKL